MALEETASAPVPVRTHPAWKVSLLAFCVWCLARAIYSTLRLQATISSGHEAVMRSEQGAILITWHGRTLIPANYYRGRGFWALISLSRDGEVQNSIFRRFGFRTIRGSSGRGGVRAALQLAKQVKEGGILAFTPDGPRGPTHVIQPGTLFLAQRSGCPIIPFGVSAHPRKLLPTWDSYLIPMPFARAALLSGEPVYVPAEAGEEELQTITEQLEAAINQLEQRAEESVGAVRAAFPT